MRYITLVLSFPRGNPSEVVRVSDGDGITVTRTGEERKIRFCGIEIPETAKGGKPGQPQGEEAKEFVEKAIAQHGNQMGIEFVEQDRYGRCVGEIWLNVGGDRWKYFSMRNQSSKLIPISNKVATVDTVLTCQGVVDKKFGSKGFWDFKIPKT